MDNSSDKFVELKGYDLGLKEIAWNEVTSTEEVVAGCAPNCSPECSPGCRPDCGPHNPCKPRG